MSLIYDWGFSVIPGREDEFEQWLARHERDLSELAPLKYEYLGTYKPVWGTADRGDYHQMWRYGAERLPDLRAAAADEGGAFTELARQYLEFVDPARQEEETFRLYRAAVTDASETQTPA